MRKGLTVLYVCVCITRETTMVTTTNKEEKTQLTVSSRYLSTFPFGVVMVTASRGSGRLPVDRAGAMTPTWLQGSLRCSLGEHMAMVALSEDGKGWKRVSASQNPGAAGSGACSRTLGKQQAGPAGCLGRQGGEWLPTGQGEPSSGSQPPEQSGIGLSFSEVGVNKVPVQGLFS